VQQHAARRQHRIAVGNLPIAPQGGSRPRNPIILLKETTGERCLPIGIGPKVATAIALIQQCIAPEVPLTHDLMRHILQVLGVRLTAANVTELHDGVFLRKPGLRQRPASQGPPIRLDRARLRTGARPHSGRSRSSTSAGSRSRTSTKIRSHKNAKIHNPRPTAHEQGATRRSKPTTDDSRSSTSPGPAHTSASRQETGIFTEQLRCSCTHQHDAPGERDSLALSWTRSGTRPADQWAADVLAQTLAQASLRNRGPWTHRQYFRADDLGPLISSPSRTHLAASRASGRLAAAVANSVANRYLPASGSSREACRPTPS